MNFHTKSLNGPHHMQCHCPSRPRVGFQVIKKKRDVNGPLDTFDGPQRKSHTRDLGLQGRAFHLVTSRQRRHWPKIYSVCETSPLHLDYLSLVKIVFLWANGIIYATAPEVGRNKGYLKTNRHTGKQEGKKGGQAR